MFGRRLALAMFLGALAGCAGVAGIYQVEPLGAGDFAPLSHGVEVQSLDLSERPDMTYAQARADLPAHQVLATFTAIGRQGEERSIVAEKIVAFAREQGADVVLFSCAVEQFEAMPHQLCAAMALRSTPP